MNKTFPLCRTIRSMRVIREKYFTMMVSFRSVIQAECVRLNCHVLLPSGLCKLAFYCARSFHSEKPLKKKQHEMMWSDDSKTPVYCSHLTSALYSSSLSTGSSLPMT